MALTTGLNNNRMYWDSTIDGYDTSFWGPEQWREFGASGGTVSANGTLVGGGLSPTGTDNLFGFTTGQWDNLGQMAGLAGQAYNIYDSLWGNKADLFKEQIGALRDQRQYNKDLIASKKKFNSNIGEGFAAAMSKPTTTPSFA